MSQCLAGSVAGVASWIALYTKPKIKSDSQVVVPTTTTDQFKDWKTYRNEEYGFEFRYPGDWEIDNIIKNFISIKSKSDIDNIVNGLNYGPSNPINITIRDNPQKSTLNDWFNNQFEGWEVLSKEFTKINEHEAIRSSLAGESSSNTIFFQLPNGQIINFTHETYNFPYTDIFNQILSTFRFINQ